MNPTSRITSEPPPLREFVNPLKLFSYLIRHREIIFLFAWREFEGNYKGTYLGLVWAFLSPLMSLAVYFFVFSIVLGARFASIEGAGRADFALILFGGIVVYNIFAVSASKAPLAIAEQLSFVKKVVFPLELLPVAALGASLLNAALGLLMLIPALVIFSPKISSTLYLFPLVLVTMTVFSLGVSWFLGSLGVFAKDLGQAMTILLQLLFFATPVIYPLSAVPESLQLPMRLNPLTTILENTRRTLVMGEGLEWGWWALITLFSLLFMQFGYVWFMKTRRYFADVM
ncbi:MAG: ABC transporter permease [Desulfomonilaceae bacterium]|nr:ABC transporter permease [Desulfomonilaceae bacterium]